ncbi:MAG: NUDIX domain-containing protein [Candidatus Taylorbacteria bacterium]
MQKGLIVHTLVVNGKGEVLILQRAKQEDVLPEYWDIPGGTLEDGDFYSLVQHLYETDKLLMVLSPYVKTCSQLLRKEAKEKIYSMENLKGKIGLK